MSQTGRFVIFRFFIGDPGLEDKPGQYVLPAGIAVDETDRIYIVDQVHNKVDVIRKLSESEIQKLVAVPKVEKTEKTTVGAKTPKAASVE